MPKSPNKIILSRISSPALILKTYPFSDSDLIFRMLTKERGKIGVLGKGMRKVFRKGSSKSKSSHLDLFDIGLLIADIGTGGLFRLQEFTHERRLSTLTTDLDKYTLASCLSEIIDTLVQEGSSDPLDDFENARLGFLAIHEAIDKKQALKAFFISTQALSRSSGILPPELAEQTASSHALRRILSTIEAHVDKPLGSKEAIESILKTL